MRPQTFELSKKYVFSQITFFRNVGLGWVSGYFEYLGLGISWVDIPKPILKTQLFWGIKL
jgi:hypothetical protein